jgi:hypothetical protein
MKLLTLVAFTFLLTSCATNIKHNEASLNKADAKEILLLGTFHYNNPGMDAVKHDVLDVMAENGQKQLEKLADKIVKYKPSKIFVEWNLNEQDELDKLYQKYLNGTYFKDENLSDFYRKNEIFQLGFRIAKKLGHSKIYGVDYSNVAMDFEAMMKAISDAKQQGLQEKFNSTLEEMGKNISEKMATMSLEEIYIDDNKPEEVAANIELYNEISVKAGTLENTAGATMVSQWYKRNLLIWSSIQKIVNENDKKVMVLFGGGHTAILDQIVRYNRNWKKADLRKVLNGSYVDIEF